MRLRPFLIGVCAIEVCALLASCGGGNPFQTAKGSSVVRHEVVSKRRAIPVFSGPELVASGAAQTIDQAFLSGRVSVVHFWGAWCVPCRQEEPEYVSAYGRYAARGVRFLGVDLRDSKAAGNAFRSEFRMPYPSIWSPDAAVAFAFHVRTVPQTFVLDRNGRIAAEVIGAVQSEEDLAALLDAELAR